MQVVVVVMQFLSTLSLRRATRFGRPIDVQFLFLSTLSLRRATQNTVLSFTTSPISIHALLAESDGSRKGKLGHTLPISIHALLAESDRRWTWDRDSARNFYPRSPCGERLVGGLLAGGVVYFYPRSPCGERRGTQNAILRNQHFYPRSPCGERRPPGVFSRA